MVSVHYHLEWMGGLGQKDGINDGQCWCEKDIVKDIFEGLPSHRRSVIDEQITLSDMSERIHHLKIVIRIKEGSEERDVWSMRNRILNMHRVGQTGVA